MMGERNFQRRVSWLPNIKEPIGVSTGIAVFNTFGQYTGGASASGFHGRHRRGAIGVQPTAVAWTRMPQGDRPAYGSGTCTTVLGGWRCIHSGHKPKEATAGKPRDKFGLMPKHDSLGGGDGDASTVVESQRKQRQASRETSSAWWRNTGQRGHRTALACA